MLRLAHSEGTKLGKIKTKGRTTHIGRGVYYELCRVLNQDDELVYQISSTFPIIKIGAPAPLPDIESLFTLRDILAALEMFKISEQAEWNQVTQRAFYKYLLK